MIIPGNAPLSVYGGASLDYAFLWYTGVQLITLTHSVGATGSFTLKNDHNETTAALDIAATASQVQSALQTLASIGAGGCTVSGNAGGPYFYTLLRRAAAGSTNTPVQPVTLVGTASFTPAGSVSVIAIPQNLLGATAHAQIRNPTTGALILDLNSNPPSVSNPVTAPTLAQLIGAGVFTAAQVVKVAYSYRPATGTTLVSGVATITISGSNNTVTALIPGVPPLPANVLSVDWWVSISDGSTTLNYYANNLGTTLTITGFATSGTAVPAANTTTTQRIYLAGNIPSIPDPTTLPTLGTANSGGSIPPGTYFVAQTWTGPGGETRLCPWAIIVVPAGNNNNTISFTAGAALPAGAAMNVYLVPLTATNGYANPSVAPTATPTGGGATGGLLAAGTYYLKFTVVQTGSGETTASPESALLTVGSTNIPRVTFPSAPPAGFTYSLYATPTNGASGTETRYASGITTATYDMAGALPSPAGPAPPTTNTTPLAGTEALDGTFTVNNPTLTLLPPAGAPPAPLSNTTPGIPGLVRFLVAAADTVGLTGWDTGAGAANLGIYDTHVVLPGGPPETMDPWGGAVTWYKGQTVG